MKTIFPVLVISMLAMSSFAQMSGLQKISASQATNYYDKEMIVTGKVVQVTIRPSVTFLNLDKSFPNSPFAITIFHGRGEFYGDANLLKGKSIEIKGKIKNYKDKPEMALDNMNQLTIIGVTNVAEFLKPRGGTITPPPTSTNAPAGNAATNFPEIM